MSTRSKKILAAFIVSLIAVTAFVVYMFMLSKQGSDFNGYMAILFVIVPAVIINRIMYWKKRKISE